MGGFFCREKNYFRLKFELVGVNNEIVKISIKLELSEFLLNYVVSLFRYCTLCNQYATDSRKKNK